jgi:hypothetical protein
MCLFQELPDHLAKMALFKVNTGTREQEVCGLKWSYEVKVPELDTSVFLTPGKNVNERRGAFGRAEDCVTVAVLLRQMRRLSSNTCAITTIRVSSKSPNTHM